MHAVMQTEVPVKIPRWTSLGEPSALEAARRRSLLATNKQTPRNVAMPQSGNTGCTVGLRCRVCNILN